MQPVGGNRCTVCFIWTVHHQNSDSDEQQHADEYMQMTGSEMRVQTSSRINTVRLRALRIASDMPLTCVMLANCGFDVRDLRPVGCGTQVGKGFARKPLSDGHIPS